MTIAIVLNIVLALIVLSVIIGMKVWAIHTARPAAAAPVPADNPHVREHAVRARTLTPTTHVPPAATPGRSALRVSQ